MALRDERTFFLEGTIPLPGREGFTCALHPPADAPTSAFPMHRSSVRLLGSSPRLTVQPVDAGPGIVIRAMGPNPAGADEATFFVSTDVIASLSAGDVIRAVYSHNADLGLAIYRRGELVAAMGALTALRLEPDVEVTIPRDLWERIDAMFLDRDPELFGRLFGRRWPKGKRLWSALGPTLVRCPYEMRVGDVVALVTSHTRSLGPFDAEQVQPPARGVETTGAKGFIVRRGVVEAWAARDTAAILARGLKVKGYRLFDGPPPEPDRARE
jgi:hypothetical protein